MAQASAPIEIQNDLSARVREIIPYYAVCPLSNLLIMAENGEITWEEVARNLLYYMSSHDDRDRETAILASQRIFEMRNK